MESESTVKDEEEQPEDYKATHKKAKEMADEALNTRSQVKVTEDGGDVKIKENAEDAERYSLERDTKTAIHGALTDIEKELSENVEKSQEKAKAKEEPK